MSERCDQTVEWIKMPLDVEVGLGPGDIVLDGDPAPPTESGASARPHFLADVCCHKMVTHLSNCWAIVISCGRLQEDPPAGVSGAPTDNNIMLWNAVIFGYVQWE